MLIAVKYIHLLSIIIWIGSVIFFSFVATPSIFKTFDRKVAGDIVGAVFPKYFMLTEAAIFVALATLVFAGLKIGMTGAIKVGLVLLVTALLVASFSGFYIGPKAREVKDGMSDRNRRDKNSGAQKVVRQASRYFDGS